MESPGGRDGTQPDRPGTAFASFYQGQKFPRSSTDQEVTIQANIYKISRINPEAGWFEAEGFVTTTWKLKASPGASERQLKLKLDREGGHDAPPLTTEEKEQHVWSPRPYFRNSVGVFERSIIWHTVERESDSDDWKVKRFDKFIGGRFQLQLHKDDKDGRGEHPLKEVALNIEMCSYRDTKEIDKFTIHTSSSSVQNPWQCVSPADFTLKPKWFLEPPKRHDMLRQEQMGPQREPEWHDEEIDCGAACGGSASSAAKYLAVATRSSEPHLSSTSRQYPMVQIRMQAVKASDEQHYRPEEGGEDERELRVRCNIFKLVKIDIKEHAFDADLFLEASWLDYSIDDQRFADSITGGEIPTVDR